MKLYHGTSSRCLDRILREGLIPRAKRKGNWKHVYSSNKEMVYLTTVYAIHYALCANSRENEDLVVVEVDTDALEEWNFAPDEEMLEQASRQDSNIECYGWKMNKRSIWFRKRMYSDYQHLWEKSLSLMGVCAYKGVIPVGAITRIAVFPFNHRIRYLSDPVVGIANHRFVGGYYRNLTKYLFGDTDFEQSILWSFDEDARPLPSRDGIEVRTLK